jgi:hypothetical protein
MNKKTNRLTALKVRFLRKPGWYHDGSGLYLQVSPSKTKSWVYRYEINGKERRRGLGSYPVTSLKRARSRAAECRLIRTFGFDPLEVRKLIDQNLINN